MVGLDVTMSPRHSSISAHQYHGIDPVDSENAGDDMDAMTGILFCALASALFWAVVGLVLWQL